ncbi:hypothetical protein V6N13_043148 [Hibiscus sabdariffa]
MTNLSLVIRRELEARGLALESESDFELLPAQRTLFGEKPMKPEERWLPLLLLLLSSCREMERLVSASP